MKRSHLLSTLRRRVAILIQLSPFFMGLYGFTFSNAAPNNQLQNTQRVVIDAMLLKATHLQTVSDRVDFFSQQLLHTPYLVHPIGEGEEGEFDRAPLFRLDGFDCFSYVTSVLSLVHAKNYQEFQNFSKAINYRNQLVRYRERLHFVDADWNPVLEHHKILTDITQQLFPQESQIARAYINKAAWMQRKTLQDLYVPGLDAIEKNTLLKKFKQQFTPRDNQNTSIAYVPLTVFFDAQQRPRWQILARIPHGCILEIVRPNWDLTQQIGTRMNVSHLGWVVHTARGVVFRNASSLKHQVAEELLADYLQHYLASDSVKGVHLEMPL